VPISTGSNNPGKAQLARMASTRLPCVNTTGSPEVRSVATTAKGDAEVFKVARFEDALDQARKPVIACQAEARDTPAGNVPESAACGKSQ